jgi:hypothetical protein
MSKIVTRCPACQERLLVTRLSCPSCDLVLEGHFEIPGLLGLDPKDLDFVLGFVRASGSLKETARIQGQSYPTIRARLDEVIAMLGEQESELELRQGEILDAVASGTLSAAEGAAKLKEMKR